MKMRTFFGMTSRSVLEQVRTALGPDAVIVANRPTPEGVVISALPAEAMGELLANGDAQGNEVRTAATTPATHAPSAHAPATYTSSAHAPSAHAPANAAVPHASATPSGRDDASGVKAWCPPDAHAAPGRAPAARRPAATDDAAARADARSPGRPSVADMGERLMEEVAAMRALIEERLGQFAWSEALRRSPLRTRFTRDLLAAGYSPQLAREITQRLPDDYSAAQAQIWLNAVLARNLQCVDVDADLVTRGGIYALVGPTGVGKTTTTAKLAARCAVRYGAGKLALITTDTYRVGAHEQLRVYAKILGVAVHAVSDANDLDGALAAARGRHLVLIDTVGMGQRDVRVSEQAALLARPGVQRLLLLSAGAQAETQEEVIAAYGRTDGAKGVGSFDGCILTKTDEAAKTGPVLDAVIRHRLPLQFVANGQRVPEDLHLPSAEYLIHRSLRIADRPTPFTLAGDDLALTAGVALEIQHA
jgi:flagellar biosynthesis protein FlhF